MDWVLAIPALPAAAFALLTPMSRTVRTKALWIAPAAIVLALVLACAAFTQVYAATPAPEPHAAEAAAGAAEAVGESAALSDPAVLGVADPVWHRRFPLASVAGSSLGLGFALDVTAAIMLVVVTLVGAAVQVYSLEYMRTDPRRGWYFAVLSLFTAAMLALVLADNYLMLYVMWELMGLCSYLLIGFWHEQEAPRKAAVKAFLTTRIGDVGFALGLAVIWTQTRSFEMTEVFGSIPNWAPAALTAASLLLLAGAMGKSAQVPLHVWLPDAMAGPTPASALIHAATMVAAGVYLVARSLPLFAASGVALSVVLAVGSVTALLAGLMGLVQHDIKKVLAYSTISQLGYLFMALGAGSYVAGMFHLVTHAFFKSLLFLGAGVIIHATHTQDMREMGGLAKKMPLTTVAFTAGALALAGVPPFSGFFSKDEVLAALLHDGHPVAFGVALLAAFVTALYVARLWFRVFTGFRRTEHAHEGNALMLAPMAVLAAVTAVGGFGSVAFARLLGHAGEWPQPAVYGPSVGAAAAGLLVGWWAYGRTSAVLNTTRLKRRLGNVYHVVEQRFYFDLTYDALLVRPFARLADRLAAFDGSVVDGAVNGAGRAWARLSGASARFDGRVIDGAVNGAASAIRAAGERLRRLQTGRLAYYQKFAVGALLLLVLLALVVKGVGTP